MDCNVCISDLCKNCTGRFLKVLVALKGTGWFQSLLISVGRTLCIVSLPISILIEYIVYVRIIRVISWCSVIMSRDSAS